MLRKFFLGAIGLIAVAATVGWFTFGQSTYKRMQRVGADNLAADYALQDDSRVPKPEPQPRVVQPRNSLKNVYWGDTHVHTHESFDAKLMGTTVTVEDAYRFAKGEALLSTGGETMQLARPLDFVAITDHAEGFGVSTRCDETDLTWFESINCYLLETPNPMAFLLLRTMVSLTKSDVEKNLDAPALSLIHISEPTRPY